MSDDTISNALKMMPYGFYAFTTKATMTPTSWSSTGSRRCLSARA